MSGALGSLYALPAVLYTGAVPLGEVPAPAAEGGERGEAAACDSSAPKDGPHSSVPTEGGATCLTCGVGAHCTGSWAGFASSCQRDVSRPASPSLHNWSQPALQQPACLLRPQPREDRPSQGTSNTAPPLAARRERSGLCVRGRAARPLSLRLAPAQRAAARRGPPAAGRG